MAGLHSSVGHENVDELQPSAGPTATHVGVELVSLRVSLGPKVLFMALRENSRGRFLKLSNYAANHAPRAKIIVPDCGIEDLRRTFALVAEKDRSLDVDAGRSPHASNGGRAITTASTENHSRKVGVDSGEKHTPASPLISERLFVRGRRFFLDVLSNDRGRYCKLSAVEPDGRRSTVAFPASGLEAVVEAIDEIIAQAPPQRTIPDPSAIERNGATGPAAHGRKEVLEILADGKRIFVEAGANQRGPYVRVGDNHASAITIPFQAIGELIMALKQIEDAGQPTLGSSSEAVEGGGAAKARGKPAVATDA